MCILWRAHRKLLDEGGLFEKLRRWLEELNHIQRGPISFFSCQMSQKEATACFCAGGAPWRAVMCRRVYSRQNQSASGAVIYSSSTVKMMWVASCLCHKENDPICLWTTKTKWKLFRLSRWMCQKSQQSSSIVRLVQPLWAIFLFVGNVQVFPHLHTCFFTERTATGPSASPTPSAWPLHWRPKLERAVERV